MKKFQLYNKFIVSAGIVASFLVTSCKETVNDIEYGISDTRLAVWGAISTDTTRHLVRLTKSGQVIQNTPYETVSNAEVSISDGTTVFPLTEDPSNKGSYYTAPNVYGVPGRTYTLTINNVDINGDGQMERYTAQSELKRENPIDSIHVLYDNSNPDMVGWYVNLFTKDIGGRNFYLVKARKNGVMMTDSVYKYSFTDNTAFEGKYFYGLGVYFFNEKYKREKLTPGDTVSLELYGITEDYFNFIMDYILEYYPKVPIFSGASSNIRTNISPGESAIGNFTAYSIERKSTVYHGEKVHF